MKILMKLSAFLLIMQLGTIVAMDTIESDYNRYAGAVAHFDAGEYQGTRLSILNKLGVAQRSKESDWVKKLEDLLAELEKKNDPTLAQKEIDQAIAVIKQAVEGCIVSDKTMTVENQTLLAQNLRDNLSKTEKSANDLYTEIGTGVCEAEAVERFNELKPIFKCSGNLPADFKFYVKEHPKSVDEKGSKRPATILSKLYKFGAFAVTLAGLAFVGWKVIYPRYKSGLKKTAASSTKAS